ncbi:BTB/POZ and MATH domain-containing protein 1-like [Lolium rigidum]|uniref:BTB/POZ and MATH domain-containing protein 1-like n=1 Tax=Lolium rigidum TaxID=89674 RepID=UPI001F5D5D18|nr:BTB/POZ and MATH domain-containing protein 1-like [Lolium rigidum]
MSTSDLISALRAGGRKLLSASTVAPRQESESHLFQIEHYTQVKKMLANCELVESSTFTVGGHDWQIECYPNGCTKRPSGWISLFLRRTSSAKEGVAAATIKFSVLDQYGNPSRTKTSPQRRFSSGDDWGWPDFMTNEDLETEKLLKDDCLLVLCDLTVDLGLRTEDCMYKCVAVPEPVGETPAPPFELEDELTKAIWEKQWADVEIKVGGETFAVHRWMLEARSPVFKEDLSLAIATGGKSTAELEIEDMDVEVVRTLIEFIYKNRLPEKKRLLETAAMAERLLVAADRYMVEKLKRICEEALCKHIGMSSVADTLALAERHGCPVLKEACMQFISSPGNLVAVVATDGFEQLKTGCPPALVDLMAKQIALVDLGRTI